jgi:hypothetical protein
MRLYAVSKGLDVIAPLAVYVKDTPALTDATKKNPSARFAVLSELSRPDTLMTVPLVGVLTVVTVTVLPEAVIAVMAAISVPGISKNEGNLRTSLYDCHLVACRPYSKSASMMD